MRWWNAAGQNIQRGFLSFKMRFGKKVHMSSSVERLRRLSQGLELIFLDRKHTLSLLRIKLFLLLLARNRFFDWNFDQRYNPLITRWAFDVLVTAIVRKTICSSHWEIASMGASSEFFTVVCQVVVLVANVDRRFRRAIVHGYNMVSRKMFRWLLRLDDQLSASATFRYLRKLRFRRRKCLVERVVLTFCGSQLCSDLVRICRGTLKVASINTIRELAYWSQSDKAGHVWSQIHY